MTKEQIEEKAEQFFKERYPLISMPTDADEVDYYQMIEFVEWLIKQKDVPCKHRYFRTTKNYKSVRKCGYCGEIKNNEGGA